MEVECAMKQLRKAMSGSVPDEISNAKTKALNACTKHERHALNQKGVPDPDDEQAQRQALDWLMEKISSHG